MMDLLLNITLRPWRMKTYVTLMSTPWGMIGTVMLTMLPLLKSLTLKLRILKLLRLQGMLPKLLSLKLLCCARHDTALQFVNNDHPLIQLPPVYVK